MDPDVFTFAGNNQKVVFQGMRISVPRTMRDREFYRTVTATELGFWDAITGELELSIPLPVVAIARGKSYINSYNIRGVWMQHPTPLWQRKRNEAEKRFKSIDPGDLLR
ncbi:transposase and inactivated derivatives [Corynebacterium glutamicum]|nr:transposase and inactivated derivatives [Corynebacterium glutamicum]